MKVAVESHCHLLPEMPKPTPLLLTPDFDGDGLVTCKDIKAVAERVKNDSEYHPLFDTNADGKITGLDVAFTAKNLGKESSLLEQQIVEVFNSSYSYYGSGGLENAIQDGFLPFTPEFKGHGIHYFSPEKFGLLQENGKELSPSDWVGLNYSPESELLAVFYLAAPDQFSFDIDYENQIVNVSVEFGDPPDIFADDSLSNYPSQEEWHTHQSVFISGVGSLDPNQVTFEQDLSGHELFMRIAVALNDPEIDLYPIETPNLGMAEAIFTPGFWMMHSWVHTLNPNGIFGMTNPLVSVDAPDEHSGGHHS